jgi:phage-related protein
MREVGDRRPILSVVFYVTAAGNEPVRDWLLGLSRDDRRLVGFDIKTAQYGWPLGMPLIRKLEPGLWEVRSHIADGIARVLFTVAGDDRLICRKGERDDQQAYR